MRERIAYINWVKKSKYLSIYFLNNPRFYEDMELISKAGTAKYALWVIGEESFNKTTSLSLSSMIIIFDYLIFSNPPKLNKISLGFDSFEE